MIIDKSFEKYLLATIFTRFNSRQASTFEHHLNTHRTSENPLQETLAAFDIPYSDIDTVATMYMYLSYSPFIYSVMKDLYDCSPPNKLTVKSHLTMTLNVIQDLFAKDISDSRIPASLRRVNALERLIRIVRENDYFSRREVHTIVN